MKTKNNLFLSMFFLICIFICQMNVNAESYTVHNEDELKSALNNNDIDTIILANDINTTEKINITRNIYIDGANHTIKYTGTFGPQHSTDNTVWGGIYVLQFYKVTGTLKDIKLTGANAGLLLNGSNVTFRGTIDVSGNGFGGIELGQGKDVTEKNTLALDNSVIVNTSEDDDHPTIWVPNDSDDATMIIDGENEIISSGEELTLTEINEIFGLTPDTYDNINFYLCLFGISLFSIIYIAKKEYQND